ncbi:unnamed protein product [Closterium sp. NIES-64]|nr:unnamed protein product [Closterium sp. NIES-64]
MGFPERDADAGEDDEEAQRVASSGAAIKAKKVVTKNKAKAEGAEKEAGEEAGEGAEEDDALLTKPPSKRQQLMQHLQSPVFITRLVMMAFLVIVVVVLTVGTWFAARTAYSQSLDAVALQLREKTLVGVQEQFLLYINRDRDVLVSLSSVLETTFQQLRTWNLTLNDSLRLVRPLLWSFFKSSLPHITTLGYYSMTGPFVTYAQYDLAKQSFASQDGSLSMVYSRNVLPNSTAPWFILPTNSSSGLPANNTPTAFKPLRLGSVELYQQIERGEENLLWTFNAIQDLSGPMLVASSADTIEGCVMYIGSSEGFLVATSTGVATSTPTGEGRLQQFVNATDVEDATIAGVARYLEREYGLPALVAGNYSLSNVDVVGRAWYVSSMGFAVDNLKLYLVIILPRTSIMGTVDQEMETMIIVTSCVAVGLLLLGWVVVIFLTLYVDTRMRPKEELQRQKEETQRAQAASEVKSQFLANISHDLRTPMAGILGLLDIMLCDHLTAEQEANLRQMKSCCASLLGLLNNLLDLAKVEAGRMQLEVLEFDIVGELESLVDMFSVQGLSNGTEIALDLSDDIERTVKGDPSRVRQVFANLLSNACKFTRNGQVIVRGWMRHNPPPHLRDSDLSIPGEKKRSGHGPSVDADGTPASATTSAATDAAGSTEGDTDTSAAAGAASAAGGAGGGAGAAGGAGGGGKEGGRERRMVTFMFEVDDSGPGIPAHKRQLVFENFQQADASTNRTHGGTGLGLGIVKSLVQLMGGHIAVVDKEGAGARFRFDLCFEALDHSSVWKNSMLQPEFLLPKLTTVEGGQVLLAMREESAGAAIACAWLERRKLHVWRATQWGDIMPAVSSMLVHRASDRAGLQPRVSRSMVGFSAPLARSFQPGGVGASGRGGAGAGAGREGVFSPIPEQNQSQGVSFRDGGGSASPAAGPAGHRPTTPRDRVPPSQPYASGSVNSGASVASPAAATGSSAGPGRAMSPASSFSRSSFNEHGRVNSPGMVGDDGAGTAGGNSFGSANSRLVLAIIDVSLVPNLYQFIAEELHIFRARLQHQGFVIAWLVEHNTSADTRRSLRRSGCAVASKPLYASRMAPLLALATARNGVAHSSSSIDMPPLPRPHWHGEDSSWSLPPPVEEEDGAVDKQAPATSAAGSRRALPSPASLAAAAGGMSPSARLIARGGVGGGGGREGGTGGGGGGAGGAVGSPGDTAAGGTGEGPGAAGGVGGASESQRDGGSGKGSTHRVGRARSMKHSPGAVGEGNFETALASKRVLIAEDTALLRKVAIIRMQKLGCEVEAVCDGQQAVDAILATYAARDTQGDAAMHFDAVLMDCQMPVLDGYGATAAIRAAESGTRFHTPIVALTAHAMTSDEKKCLDAGMDAYLTKPIDPALMAHTLLSLMTRYPRCCVPHIESIAEGEEGSVAVDVAGTADASAAGGGVGAFGSAPGERPVSPVAALVVTMQP